jgi:glycerol-1-phosphate dehydrogenase [NAD(P)+]
LDNIEVAEPIYGTDLIASLKPEFTQDCVVYYAPESWEHVKGQFKNEPKEIAVPQSMEQSIIEKQVTEMSEAEVVFGIGGGPACDAAKMHAFQRNARLVLVPSILSVDAAFTKAMTVRVDDCVRYVGSVIPEKLLVDFELLQKAPPRLNRAGVGDILSIYTALFDWHLAADATGEKYDEERAGQARKLLELLVGGVRDICDASEDGLRLITELFTGQAVLRDLCDSVRPSQGSEHHFAHCLESITKRSYIHGELIAMSVVLTTLYQVRPVKNIMGFLDKVEVPYHPAEVGVTYDEIWKALLRLPQYLEKEKQHLFGIYHHKGMDEKKAEELIKMFRSVVGD